MLPWSLVTMTGGAWVDASDGARTSAQDAQHGDGARRYDRAKSVSDEIS